MGVCDMAVMVTYLQSFTSHVLGLTLC